MTTGTVMGVHDRLYIGGEWVKPTGDESIAVLNPAPRSVASAAPATGANSAGTASTSSRT